MNNTKHPTDDALLDLLDGRLAPPEHARLLEVISQQPDVQRRLDTLRNLHQLMQQSARTASVPGPDFTAGVMAMLTQQAPLASSAPAFRHGRWLLAGSLLVTILASVLLSLGIFDNVTFNMSALPWRPAPGVLPEQLLSGKLFMNVVILLNLVVGWLMLDRLVLQPYFRRREGSANS